MKLTIRRMVFGGLFLLGVVWTTQFCMVAFRLQRLAEVSDWEFVL